MIFMSSCYFKTLPLDSPTPFVKAIYAFADNETKKQLKLVNKSFWREHALDKFRNNYSPAQEPRHRQLYCYDPCPNVDEFEVKIDINS